MSGKPQAGGLLPPTARRVATALRESDLPLSAFFTKAVSVLFCLCLAVAGAGWAVGLVVALMRSSLQGAFAGDAFSPTLGPAWIAGCKAVCFILGPVLGVGWGAMAIVGLVQMRGRLRFPTLLGGRKRGSGSGGQMLPIVTVVVVTIVAASCLWGSIGAIAAVGLNGDHRGAGHLLSATGTLTQRLLVRLGASVLVLGVLDLAWQWWRWRQSLRMTHAEVQEESRLTQGDPVIRKEQLRLGRQ